MAGSLHDSLYSWSLLIALIAAGLGALLCVYFLTLRLSGRGAGRNFIRLARVTGPLALITMIFSVTVHLVFGHAPTSPEPMGALEFMFRHEAYWLVLVLAVLACCGPTLAERRR